MDRFPMPPFLAAGEPWPPADVHGTNYAETFKAIKANRQLFKAKHHEVFVEQYKRLQAAALGDATENREPTTHEELLARLGAAASRVSYEQEINLPQAVSLLWADLIAGRPPRVGAGVFAATAGSTGADASQAKPGPAEEAALQRLATDLVTEIYEALLEQSYAGDGVFLATWTRDGGARVVSYPADQVIPWSETGDPKRITAYVIFRQEAVKVKGQAAGNQTILSVEVHYRGLVRYRRYQVDGGRITAELEPVLPEGSSADQELPIGVTEFLVQPFSNSVKTATDFRGDSDYDAFETLVAEFDVRASQWGKLGDKFTAPTMYGPDTVLEQDIDHPGHWLYKTSPDGKYIPVADGEQQPGYMVWDPQFQMQSHTWDRLMEMFYVCSGTTPAAFSNFKEGSGISGTALRLRMARPLMRAGSKRERMEPALRRSMLAAQQLEVALGGAQYRPSLPVFEWADSLPSDSKEQAETEQIRKDAALTTTKAALMRLDGLSESEAEEEAAEIQAEQKAAMETAIPATAGDDDLNGPDGQELLKAVRALMAQDPDLTEEAALKRARAERGNKRQ